MINDHRTRAARAYLEARVQSASPAELIALLYEGLVKEVRLALSALDRRDVVERGVAIGRAVGILAELRTNLDHESGGEVATNLERLYAYWTRRITEAHARTQRGPLDEIVPQIESLRSAWNEGVVRGTASPVNGPPRRAAAAAQTTLALRHVESALPPAHVSEAAVVPTTTQSVTLSGVSAAYAAALATGPMKSR